MSSIDIAAIAGAIHDIVGALDPSDVLGVSKEWIVGLVPLLLVLVLGPNFALGVIGRIKSLF